MIIEARLMLETLVCLTTTKITRQRGNRRNGKKEGRSRPSGESGKLRRRGTEKDSGHDSRDSLAAVKRRTLYLPLYLPLLFTRSPWNTDIKQGKAPLVAVLAMSHHHHSQGILMRRKLCFLSSLSSCKNWVWWRFKLALIPETTEQPRSGTRELGMASKCTIVSKHVNAIQAFQAKERLLTTSVVFNLTKYEFNLMTFQGSEVAGLLSNAEISKDD